MKFVKQPNKLSIVNLDELINKNPRDNKFKKHGKLLPNNVRSLIVGPSSCGKTNVMLNLLFSPDGLYFENIYVFSKTLYQRKYEFLKCVLSNIPGIGYFAYSENEEVPSPNQIQPNSVIIFDDVSCEKQNNIKNYFSMGRHNSVDSFFICQTYSRISKQLVRDNANLVIVFRQDERNLQHIYRDHVNLDMNFDEFKLLCSKVWSQSQNNFLVIVKDCDIDKGRYRSGFDVFIRL